MERIYESQFKTIIGGTYEEKAKAREKLHRFLNDFREDKLALHELAKPEKDRRIIEEVATGVDKIVEFYGADPTPLPTDKVHVLELGAVRKVTDGELSGGFHTPLRQRIAVERDRSDVAFAVTIAHELLHAKSYKSAQVKRGEVVLHRSGLLTVGRQDETEYFGQLEEAIVSELEHLFYKKEIKDNPAYRGEIEATEKVKPWIDKLLELNSVPKERREALLRDIYSMPEAGDVIPILEGSESEEYKLGYLAGSVQRWKESSRVAISYRVKEREKLHRLLGEILDKSAGRFKNKREIFDEFAKAHFTGNLLPLARTIERSLGKGSFRRIAEEFKS